MALQKSRDRVFVKGLGNLQFLQVEPTVGTVFQSAGHLKNTTLDDSHTVEIIKAENGMVIDMLEKDRTISVETALMQSSIDEINLVKNASGLVYAARYNGITGRGGWQYFGFEKARINPSVNLKFMVGERDLPLKMQALGQPDLGYDVPEYYTVERLSRMYVDDVNLWIEAALDLNVGTQKILDVSGFARHGTPTSTYANIWQNIAGLKFLRFSGTTDAIDFGSILNDDGTTDFVIELWVRFTGTNGVQEEVLAKKTLVTGNSAGFALYRTAGNLISFNLGSGTAAAAASSSATVLQNVWKHVAVSVKRNGNAQVYLNGAADGSPVSVAAIGTGTNALSLFLGRDGTNIGQSDVGGVRIHSYPGGSLPTSIATIIAAHFAAERSIYGV